VLTGILGSRDIQIFANSFSSAGWTFSTHFAPSGAQALAVRAAVLVGPNELRALGGAIRLTLSFDERPAASLTEAKARPDGAERPHDRGEERLSQVCPKPLGFPDATRCEHVAAKLKFIALRAERNRPRPACRDHPKAATHDGLPAPKDLWTRQEEGKW